MSKSESLTNYFQLAGQILDNTPKGEDYVAYSKRGLGYIHIDSAGASFRFCLEAANQGRKELSHPDIEIDKIKSPEQRTLGAWVGQQFAQAVIEMTDENPDLNMMDVYSTCSKAIFKKLCDSGSYEERPVWQREAWSFTHVFVKDGFAHIFRVGDVAAFLMKKNGKIEHLPEAPFHNVEGPYQKSRTDYLINTMKLSPQSDEFFALDYSGFHHDGNTFEGLVKNRQNMIDKTGMWSGINGSFQAILGHEDHWCKDVDACSVPLNNLIAIVTSSDGLYHKGVNIYDCFDMEDFVVSSTQAGGLEKMLELVRMHEREAFGRVYPDDASAVALVIK